MEKSKLHVISLSEQKASPGMVRAAMMIDSEIYQIGDDVPTILEAKRLCADAAGFSNPVAIFNDQGKEVGFKTFC